MSDGELEWANFMGDGKFDGSGRGEIQGCSCLNGKKATLTSDPKCPTMVDGKVLDGIENCQSCKSDLYTLVPSLNDTHASAGAKICKGNECRCMFGTATKTECTKEGANICESCDVGYHLTDDKRCMPNKCWCKRGDQTKWPLSQETGNPVPPENDEEVTNNGFAAEAQPSA